MKLSRCNGEGGKSSLRVVGVFKIVVAIIVVVVILVEFSGHT